MRPHENSGDDIRATVHTLAAMSTTIRLLGEPAIVVDGDTRALAGHKTWALLAYLLLGSRTGRRDIAELLWPEANDPLAAERWALLQVRRALIGIATIETAEHRLTVVAGRDARIDALLILSGATGPDEADELTRGQLLAGMSFDDAPAYEQWLTLERQRLFSAQRDALRHGAMTLAPSDPERALRLIDRALSFDPFDDALHELAVDLHLAHAGPQAAERYAAAAEHRYRAELGIGLPATVRRPLLRPQRAIANPLVDLRVATEALLDAASARFDAGDYAGAVDAARRAAGEAAAAGDGALEARALAALAGTLIHSVRGRDREATGLLERALRLAGTDAARAEIERELGYVAFLAADYGAAEAALRRAVALAVRAEAPDSVGRALTLIGACESDRGDFDRAIMTLTEAAAALHAARDRWEAFALSFLARAQIRAGRPADARPIAARAVALARETRWLSLLPWCMAHEAEAASGAGDQAVAQRMFSEAFALGCEIADPCWEAMSLRGLALLDAAAGRTERARAMLTEAVERCIRVSDTYRWVEAVLLTDLIELEGGSDRTHLDRALWLVRRGPMADLAQRLQRFERQTASQTP